MSLWEIINSPIALTLIGLIWGSLVASWVTALWQRRSHNHEVKLQYAQDVINAYQEYVRLIRGNSSRLSGDDFDTLHSRMVSYAKIAGFIFKDEQVGQGWGAVVDKLTNIRGLCVQGRESTLIERKLKDVYSETDNTIEKMFKELV